MKKSPQILLQHILESIKSLESYLQDVTKAGFFENPEKQDAVVRRLEIIGEAVTAVSMDFKSNYPVVPWQDISDMRNRLIHEYYNVDLELVWEVLEKDIPKLKNDVLNIIKSLE